MPSLRMFPSPSMPRCWRARGGAAAGGATGRNAALELLLTQPDGSRIAAAGMLEDVRITADARTNRLFLTGPAESLDLLEQLIQTLDETPAAAAQIKVFQVTNGDASELVLVLRSLFPEGGVSTVPQLAVAEGETRWCRSGSPWTFAPTALLPPAVREI